MGNLTDQILGGAKPEAVTEQPSETLADTVLSTPTTELPRKLKLKAEASQRMNELKAFGQGLKDILNTAATGVGYIDKTINPENTPKYDKLQSDISEENKSFKETNPPSEGILPTTPEVARMAGQTLATAPLLPMKAIQGVRGALGALPTVTATGEKVAAPFLNKAAASVVTGGATGAEFGALTSSSNDESLLENTGKGLITGALAGPVLTTAASVGKNVLPVAKNLWAGIQVNKIAEQAHMEPSAVKRVVTILENAGYSPQQAQLALNKLGPNATLTDLASSIQEETSGLANMGNAKATELLKGRFEARGKTANSEAHQILETKLGPKPNLEAEREDIIKKVRADVGPDYKAAHANPIDLDIQPVVNSIDNQLKNAVGPKAAALKQLKGFLFRTETDATGNEIKVLKSKVDQLHEIREAIDDVINDKNPTTSYGKNALRAIKDIRTGIDKQLKTVPEMASADAKFADKMQILKNIDTGEALLKGNGTNKEEFARFFDALTPERQAAVAKGMHGNIGDLMEGASRGELSEAQRLFGKNSRNRANVEKVFGGKGTEILDALEKEAMFRNSERSVHGSQTASRQALQRVYGVRDDGPGAGQILHGAALDLVTGTPGGATALMTVKRAGSHVGLKISEGRRDRLIEGTADILSRSAAERDSALGIASRIKAVQDSIKPKYNFSLPVKMPTYLLSAPTGQLGYSSYKKLGQE